MKLMLAKIFGLDRKIKIFVSILLDIVLSLVAFFIAQEVSFIEEKIKQTFNLNFVIFVTFTITFIAIQAITRSYLDFSRYFRIEIVYKILKNFLIFVVFLILYKFLLFRSDISKYSIFVYLTLFFTLIIFKNSILYNLYNFLFYRFSKPQKKILFFGFNEKVLNLQSIIKNNFQVIGIIKNSRTSKHNIPNNFEIYKENQLEEIIKLKKVSDILIAEKSNYKKRLFYFRKFIKFNIRVIFIDDVLNQFQQITEKDIFSPNFDDVIQENKKEKIVFSNSEKMKFNNKKIVVLGGAGSIGANLSEKLSKLKLKRLIIVDKDEYSLYSIRKKLSQSKNCEYHLLDTTNLKLLNKIYKKHKPNFVFNAAAYKHVSIVEENLNFSLINNIQTALNVCKLALKYKIEKNILVSTDKAVLPKNFMGASKKICEIIYLCYAKKISISKHLIVRFGNVVGSRGSVLPFFQSLIDKRLPLPLTSKKATRYLMSINQAAELIIKISLHGDNSKVYLLDMGKAKNMYNLAYRLVKFNGLSIKNKDNPTGDIIIKVVGLDKGEKLHEKLSYSKKMKRVEFGNIFICDEKVNSSTKLKNIEYLVKNIHSVSDSKLKLSVRNIIS